MSKIQRVIGGPQERFERNGLAGLRDVRPFTVKWAVGLRSSASALVLAGAAGITYLYPASVNLTVPASLLYAAWVINQRLFAPIRLPRSARCLEYNYPDPATRRARMAAGDIFIGWDQQTGEEIWITNEDGRQHATVPGTTGACKTTAILSLLCNALAQGSGFILVDGTCTVAPPAPPRPPVVLNPDKASVSCVQDKGDGLCRMLLRPLAHLAHDGREVGHRPRRAEQEALHFRTAFGA